LGKSKEKSATKRHKGKLTTNEHEWTLFFDADFAGYAGRFLVSLLYLANFAPKASFITKLCLRPPGHFAMPCL
jgi:hypothetical protein